MRRLLIIALFSAIAVSAQTKKVVVVGQSDDVVRDWQAVSSKLKIVNVDSDDVMKEIADADAFVGNITPEQVRAGKKLKWVHTMSAGVEQVLFRSGGNDLRDSDIVLTNNQIVQGPEIADHAFALLLGLTREIPRWLALKAEKKWQGTPRDLYELRGKTAVVIGVGGIGTQIAIRAWAFGMNVIGVDPEDIPFTPFITKVVKPDQIDEVLPQADVIFISAPHTPKSDRMIGASQFAEMKKGAWFIAVSRGGTYDLNSLVKALDSERLAGAGVDVVYTSDEHPEPLPPNHPLWGFKNVIITPHIAGRSDMDRGRMVGTVTENLKRFADGQPLVNVVDKKKGY